LRAKRSNPASDLAARRYGIIWIAASPAAPRNDEGGSGVMGRFVRLVSIGFAIFSVLFWLTVQGIIGIQQQITGNVEPSKWGIWLSGSLPAIIYAVICVFVFHWFARKIIKKVGEASND
jgi:small-conductance mechanosensitive channel